MPLNLMLNDPTTDLSYMNIVPNPDPAGINTSNYVVKFLRDKDGAIWGGFWSPTAVDVTTNQYMHVKVWKPRISPLKFKIEGGAAGNLEAPSTNPQTSTGVWEDMVFDLTSKTGVYPTISFMPDFEDPLTLTEDMVMYFDDIILNNDPNPVISTVPITINVDMHGSGLAVDQPVYLSGDFGLIYGTWSTPGDNPNNELTDQDGDSIYSLQMAVDPGDYNFKFFKGAGWSNGEWAGDPNRPLTVTAEQDFTYKWGVKPAFVTFNVNMKGSGLAGEDIYVAGDFGGIYGTWNTPGDNLNNLLTALEPLTDSIYSIDMALDSIGIYQLKFFKGAGWNGGEWTGDPNRIYTIRQDTTFNLKWGLVYPEGIRDISLAGKIQTYPNPVKDVLNINTSIDLNKVTITNTVGQQVYLLNNVGVGKRTINLEELSNGMYFITFYAETGAPYTLKFLKY
jgi:hypothetical protein